MIQFRLVPTTWCLCCGYTFELHRLVDAIQMGTHNMPLHRSRQKYTGCNLKTMELLDCELTGVCAVIRSSMVFVICWFCHKCIMDYHICTQFLDAFMLYHTSPKIWTNPFDDSWLYSTSLRRAFHYHRSFVLIWLQKPPSLFDHPFDYPLMCQRVAAWGANSVDPDQMLQNVASDLGLQRLFKPVYLG